MLFQVSDYREQKPRQRREPKKPAEQEKSAERSLWTLDDTRPAGPYRRSLDDFGLRLVCLAVIRQAILDERSARNPDVVARARQFLSGPGRDWLRAMHIFRRGGVERVYDLIYHSDYEGLLLLLDEPENDEPGQ